MLAGKALPGLLLDAGFLEGHDRLVLLAGIQLLERLTGIGDDGQKSLADLKVSVDTGTLVRSMAHNMTVLQKYRGAMMEVITEFVADDSISPQEAANQLADAVELQM